MAIDKNLINYPTFLTSNEDPGEAHSEEVDESLKTNVKDYEHPFFTSNGMIQTINWTRSLANSDEDPLSGEIKEDVFKDISEASRKTKVPFEFLMMICDWEQDVTDRSSASDAMGFAEQIRQAVGELRSTLGRDPLGAEVFAAHVLGSASKVKQILELAESAPEEEAKNPGSKKDSILVNKKRGTKTQKRTNREVYDFFRKRTPLGSVFFMDELGKDKYGS